jgi:methionyl-tRNA formyltransferase
LNIYRTKKTGIKVLHSNTGVVVERNDKELLVAAADGVLSMQEVQLEGKKRLLIEEFLRGYKIEKGDKLG